MTEKRTINKIIQELWEEAQYVCGSPFDLSEDERILVEILYYLRNTKNGLEYCIKNQIYPGPKGKKCKTLESPKRVIWMPIPAEACDKPLDIGTEVNESGKIINYNPFFYYKHCKTREHCEYLVKHRISHVINFFKNSEDLRRLVVTTRKGCLILALNSNIEWIKDFAIEAISGSKLELDRNLLTKSDVYKPLLKKGGCRF